MGSRRLVSKNTNQRHTRLYESRIKHILTLVHLLMRGHIDATLFRRGWRGWTSQSSNIYLNSYFSNVIDSINILLDTTTPSTVTSFPLYKMTRYTEWRRWLYFRGLEASRTKHFQTRLSGGSMVPFGLSKFSEEERMSWIARSGRRLTSWRKPN